MDSACWRDLRRYKYQFTNNYTRKIPPEPAADVRKRPKAGRGPKLIH